MNLSGTIRTKTAFLTSTANVATSEAFMTVSPAGIMCPRRTEHPLNFISFPATCPALQQKAPRFPVPKTSHSAKKLAKPVLVASSSSSLNTRNRTSRPSSNSYTSNPILPAKKQRAQTTKDKSSINSATGTMLSSKSTLPSRNVSSSSSSSKRKGFVVAGQKHRDNNAGNKTKKEISSRGRQELFYVDQSDLCRQQRQKNSPAASLLPAHPPPEPTFLNSRPSTDFTLRAVLATSKGALLSERFQVIRSDEEIERNPECIRLDRCALKQFPLIGNANTRDKEAANLRLLSLQHNLITRLENLPSLNHLVVLDLYDNRVERITGLQGLCSLRVLLLGKNRIKRIEGLDGLKRLEVLDLHGNQLRYVDSHLGSLSALRVLNLAGNLLRNIRNLGPYGLSALSELNLRRNRIRNLDGLQKAPHLKKLLLANNDLQSLSSLYSLRKLVFLQEVLLEPNPLCSVPDYRSQVLTVFPWLELLDRCPVTDQMRLDAKIWHRKKIAEEEDKRKEHSRLRTAPGSREQIIYQARQRWESVKNFVKNSNSTACKQPLSSPLSHPPSAPHPHQKHTQQSCTSKKQPAEEEAEESLSGESEEDGAHFQYIYDQDAAVDEDGNEQQGACGGNNSAFSCTSDHHHALPISFNTFLRSDILATASRLMIDDPPTGIRVNSNGNSPSDSHPPPPPPQQQIPSSPPPTPTTQPPPPPAFNPNRKTTSQHDSPCTNMINSNIGACCGNNASSLQKNNHSCSDQQQIDPLSTTKEGKQNNSTPAHCDKDKSTKIAVVRPLVRDVHFNETEMESFVGQDYLTNSNELKLHDNDDGAGVLLAGAATQQPSASQQGQSGDDVIRLLSVRVGSKNADDVGEQVVGKLTELQAEVRIENQTQESNANVMATFERDTTTEKLATHTETDLLTQQGDISARKRDRPVLRRSVSTCLPTTATTSAGGPETVDSSCPPAAGATGNCPTSGMMEVSGGNKGKMSSLRNLRSASFDVRFPSSDSDSSDETCSIATSTATSDLSPRRGLRKQLFPRSRSRLKLRGIGSDRANLRAQSSIVTMSRRQGSTLPGASRNDMGKSTGKSGALRRCDSAAVGETSSVAPMKKQGTDYLVEIDGKILSIYGQGALKHTLMGFPASMTCNVTTAKFHYISYDSIIPYFGKLRQIYPSLEHFQFRANNLGTLAQLNALADLQGLTSLHIAKEGNIVVQHELWPHYATYRLSHWGLQNVNGKEVSSEYRGGTLSSQAKAFESLGYVALSCLPQTALTPLAKRLHMLHCFCCCSPSSSSDDSGRRKGGANGSPTESSGNICTSWDDDPVLLDVIGKEALVYLPTLQERQSDGGKDGNGSSGGPSDTLRNIINSGCEILEKLDMLEKVWPSLMTEVIQDILMDYLFMDNYMKKELKKLQDVTLLSKRNPHP